MESGKETGRIASQRSKPCPHCEAGRFAYVPELAALVHSAPECAGFAAWPVEAAIAAYDAATEADGAASP